MPYNPQDYKHERILNYAKTVAREVIHLPVSSCGKVTREKTGLIFKKTVLKDATKPLAGWVLIKDAKDGYWSILKSRFPAHKSITGLEEGRALILTLSGELLRAEYSIGVDRYSDTTIKGYETGTITTRPVTADDIISFDRLNRYTYRTARHDRATENLREELGIHYAVKVPHPGMETTLALKRLREEGSYIKNLVMHI